MNHCTLFWGHTQALWRGFSTMAAHSGHPGNFENTDGGYPQSSKLNLGRQGQMLRVSKLPGDSDVVRAENHPRGFRVLPPHCPWLI